MPSHNRTPKSVLEAPIRTVEFSASPAAVLTLGEGKEAQQFVGRAQIRAVRRAQASEERRARRMSARFARAASLGRPC